MVSCDGSWGGNRPRGIDLSQRKQRCGLGTGHLQETASSYENARLIVSEASTLGQQENATDPTLKIASREQLQVWVETTRHSSNDFDRALLETGKKLLDSYLEISRLDGEPGISMAPYRDPEANTDLELAKAAKLFQ
jgi:hypothetical protein